MKKKRTVGQELVESMQGMLDALRNDTPMKTTTYERMKDGTLKRTVAMKKPSELKKNAP